MSNVRCILWHRDLVHYGNAFEHACVTVWDCGCLCCYPTSPWHCHLINFGQAHGEKWQAPLWPPWPGPPPSRSSTFFYYRHITLKFNPVLKIAYRTCNLALVVYCFFYFFIITVIVSLIYSERGV